MHEKKCSSRVGMARSNLENHARGKVDEFLQCFSCNFEGMKRMLATPQPEVKSVDAVVTFDAATLGTQRLAREVVQHSRMCTVMQERARTKTERRNARERKFMFVEHLQCDNVETTEN